jgi:hypothetical protein
MAHATVVHMSVVHVEILLLRFWTLCTQENRDDTLLRVAGANLLIDFRIDLSALQSIELKRSL